MHIYPLARLPSSATGSCRGCRGFTILELVIVITIAGVLAAVISVNWQSSAAYTIATQADHLASRLRHVQVLASGSQELLRVAPNASGYTVTCQSANGSALCASVGATVRDPASGELLNITLDDGVTLSGSALDFDTWGRPRSGVSLITAARDFVLTGGGKTFTVSVTPVTGHVSVSP